MIDKKLLGDSGEQLALQIAYGLGYDILDVKYRCHFGEIDLIGSKGGVISFFEVKTRMDDRFGRPCQSVDGRKQQKIRRCAEYYCMTHGYQDYNISFPVIEVMVNFIDRAFEGV